MERPDQLALLKRLSVATPSRIVLCVVDGLGGVPMDGKTELGAARTPHLDRLAKEGSCGLLTPLAPGITVGSGPGHLALFGYDPLAHEVGRGVLDTLGVGFELREGDLAARINFCTVDESGIVTDRRAGRISSERGAQLCRMIGERVARIEDVEVFVRPTKQYRAVVVFRGKDLSDALSDTDPQRTGERALEAKGEAGAKKAARIVNAFVREAAKAIEQERPANMLVLRGFSLYAPPPQMRDVYKLTPAAIAAYPAYKGVARLLGMEVLEAGDTLETEVACLKESYAESRHDFFFLHFKDPDAAGEDGDFARKARLLEQFDAQLGEILSLKPDVIAVTGDHCTPAKLKAHSWHPVPLVLHAEMARADGLSRFTERECARGSLGQLRSTDLMPLLLAHALKLHKFGA